MNKLGKYSGILICSDFDGTVFCNHTISAANAEAIRYFQKNGGLFTIATGRYPSFIAGYSEIFLPNAPVVALNGALIYDLSTHTPIFSGFMTGDYSKRIMRAVHEIPGLIDASVFFENDNITLRLCSESYADLEQAMQNTVYKIILHVDKTPAVSESARDAVRLIMGKQYNVSRSWIGGIEILNADFTKGKTVRRLSRLVNADKLICIGDYENDISMIREADIGYAVGDAVPELHAVADRITVPAAQDAIAEMIYEL